MEFCFDHQGTPESDFDSGGSQDRLTRALTGITEVLDALEESRVPVVDGNGFNCLTGRALPADAPKLAVGAAMSVPRLGFTANMQCALTVLPKFEIPMRLMQGVYWEQCLTRVLESYVNDSNATHVLTLDYDTVFSQADVQTMLRLARTYPEADVICSMQMHRCKDVPLFTMPGTPIGESEIFVPAAVFNADLVPIQTGHFGLTLIRTDRLRAMPKPWFCARPDPDGGWGEGRQDADISFWYQLEACGGRAYVAPRVHVGHMELSVRWGGQDMGLVRQQPGEFFVTGKPKGAWQ